MSDFCNELPPTQAGLAEAAGLKPVHVSRMLQELRRQGLVAPYGRELTVLDLEGRLPNHEGWQLKRRRDRLLSRFGRR